MRTNNSFAVSFTREEFEFRCGLRRTPLDGQPEHTPQNAKRTINRTHLQAFGLPMSCEVSQSFAGDLVKLGVGQWSIAFDRTQTDPILL